MKDQGSEKKATEGGAAGHRKAFLSWAAGVILIVILAAYCSSHWFQLMLIQDNSMMPTFHHLQLTLLDKRDVEIKRGDVIAFRQDSLSAVLVKRVAAVPGDTAVITDGTLCINGQSSRFFKENAFEYAGILSDPIKLGEDEYIVIGDNVSESRDSRYPEIGVIKKSDCIGKVPD